MSGVVTVPELLDGHTVLDIECLDRLYLNGYVPKLQVGGQVVTFLHDHRGMPIVSPAVFEQVGTRFRRAVARFADSNGIPVIKFKKGIRKAAVMEPTACGPRSSTPRSTTGSCAHSWRATNPRRHPRSAPPSASSMVRSPAASPLHGCQQPPDQPPSAVHAYISGLKTQDRCQNPSSQARLGRRRRGRRGRGRMRRRR
jgi:hypothetical protein